MTGDVLFNEGGDRDKLGRGWIWQDELPICIHQNHVFRVRLWTRDVLPELVSHHGNTFGQRWFLDRGTQSVNLASINQAVLRSFPVPIPPRDEQIEIARMLNDVLAVSDVLQSGLSGQLTRAAHLRQSILKHAFEGRLVPQDPDDEPASVLLERIRAERGAEQSAPRPPAGAKRRSKATPRPST